MSFHLTTRASNLCAHCQAPFTRTNNTQRYCSTTCRNAARRVPSSPCSPSQALRTCVGCGTEFKVPASRLKYGPALWCSTTCRYSTPGWAESLKPPAARRWATCEICGTQFGILASKIGRFCSRRCVGVANGRRQAAQTRNQHLYTCAYCGAQFTDKACLKYRKQFCSRACNGAAQARHMHLLRPTSIERALRAALAAVGIETVAEHPIGPFSIDLALPDRRIAIEADGTYWHSLPNRQAGDARKNAYLATAGWTLLRFSENRINTDLAGCVRAVQAVL